MGSTEPNETPRHPPLWMHNALCGQCRTACCGQCRGRGQAANSAELQQSVNASNEILHNRHLRRARNTGASGGRSAGSCGDTTRRRRTVSRRRVDYGRGRRRRGRACWRACRCAGRRGADGGEINRICRVQSHIHLSYIHLMHSIDGNALNRRQMNNSLWRLAVMVTLLETASFYFKRRGLRLPLVDWVTEKHTENAKPKQAQKN